MIVTTHFGPRFLQVQLGLKLVYGLRRRPCGDEAVQSASDTGLAASGLHAVRLVALRAPRLHLLCRLRTVAHQVWPRPACAARAVRVLGSSRGASAVYTRRWRRWCCDRVCTPQSRSYRRPTLRRLSEERLSLYRSQHGRRRRSCHHFRLRHTRRCHRRHHHCRSHVPDRVRASRIPRRRLVTPPSSRVALAVGAGSPVRSGGARGPRGGAHGCRYRAQIDVCH